MPDNPFKTISQKQVYHTPWVDVREDEIVHPNGQPGIYSVVELPDFAIILPLADDHRLWMVKLWRYPREQFSWELPMGRIDDGETPAETAIRELREETGLTSSDWQDLGKFSAMNGVTNCQGHAFVAKALSGEAFPQDSEIDQTKTFSVDEIYRLMGAGELHDAETIAALWIAHVRGII